MTPDITIICNVQRIGPVYETKRIYFGLNVSVGLTQAQASWDDTVDDLLKPWNWNLEDAGIEILVADRTACSFQPVKDVVIVDAKLSMDVSPLVKRLDEQYDLLKNHSKDNLAPFLWPDDCDIRSDDKPRTYSFSGVSVYWHALLMELATQPYPVPQMLNLSFLLAIPVEKKKVAGLTVDKNTIIVAAPRFST